MATKLTIDIISARTVRPRRERLMDLIEFEIQMHPHTHTAAFWRRSLTRSLQEEGFVVPQRPSLCSSDIREHRREVRGRKKTFERHRQKN